MVACTYVYIFSYHVNVIKDIKNKNIQTEAHRKFEYRLNQTKENSIIADIK